MAGDISTQSRMELILIITKSVSFHGHPPLLPCLPPPSADSTSTPSTLLSLDAEFAYQHVDERLIRPEEMTNDLRQAWAPITRYSDPSSSGGTGAESGRIGLICQAFLLAFTFCKDKASLMVESVTFDQLTGNSTTHSPPPPFSQSVMESRLLRSLVTSSSSTGPVTSDGAKKFVSPTSSQGGLAGLAPPRCGGDMGKLTVRMARDFSEIPPVLGHPLATHSHPDQAP
jgi:hypothetical protein